MSRLAPLAILLLAAMTGAVGCAERSAMMRAYDQKEQGKSAFAAGKHDECLEHYDQAIAVYERVRASQPPSAQKHWWAWDWIGEARMARAHCLKGLGKTPAAITEMDEGIKMLLTGTQNDCCTAEFIKKTNREYAASMTEVLAKWNKELVARGGK